MKNAFVFICCVVICLNLKGQYSASNFTLISLISPEINTNGYGDKYSGCWGWYQVAKNKEYAIAGSASGTFWVDITNPTTPTVSAFQSGKINSTVWREIKTYQNFCYVVSDDGGPNSFQIFDMQYLPDSVHKVYDSDSIFKRGHTLWIDGNKLYVAGVTYSTGTTSSMEVFSLANPVLPVLIRKLSQDAPFISYVHDMMVRNDTVYASCGYQGLNVFKLNTNNTFTQLGSLNSYSASGFNHSSDLTPNGQTLVFTDEVPSGLPFKTADITNLSNIHVLATANQFPQTTPHNVFIVNNQYVFLSSYLDGTQLYDISNPANPVLAGFFDTFPQGGGNNNNWSGDNYNGQWGMYPYFPSKTIFACDQLNGLFLLKTSLFQNPISIPTASFNSASNICVGAAITFTNMSLAATNYTWNFQGGTPPISTLTNPTITYTLAGIYSTTLTASDGTTASTFVGNPINVIQLQSSISSTNATCGTCTNGLASVSVTSGSAPYTYTWLPTGGNASTAYSLSPSCYSIIVNDVNGCVVTSTVCVSFITKLQNNKYLIDLLVYPNPANGRLTINFPGENFNYTLFTNEGQLINCVKNNHEKVEINLNEFLKGIYFLELEIGQEVLRKKIIIN